MTICTTREVVTLRKKLIGDPGTGKTTTLVKMAQELGLEDTTFCTFTVSALKEFGERYNINPKLDMKYWNTIHGLLYRMLMSDEEFRRRSLKTKSLARGIQSVRAKFCREYGIPYNPLDPFTEDEGKRFFSEYTYYVNKHYPNHLDHVEDYSIYHLMKKYEEFKEKNGYIDFEDMLMFAFESDLILQTDNLIVDEAMDLSPLQWEIIQKLSSQAENFIVAGDELQSIFSFQGAEPSLFNSVSVDEVEILPQTHRVPSNIWDFGGFVVRKQLMRKRAIATKDRGMLRDIGRVDFSKLARISTTFDDVLILFRTNELVAEFSAFLTQQGIPHKHLKIQSIWETDFVGFITAYHKLKRGVAPNESEARAFLKRSKNPEKLKSLKNGVIPVFMYGHDPDIFIDESLLTPIERTAFRKLKNSKLLSQRLKTTIVVDTIHSAKGREAETVILVDGITEKIYRELYEPERLREEERVWYVGVTRAKKRLIICRLANLFPFITNYYRRWVNANNPRTSS